MAQTVPDILKFLHRANSLKGVRRYKSSLAAHGDTVSDHSWRLALMVFVVGAELGLPVNVCHAMKIALLHDLAELETDDVDAVDVLAGRVSRATKQKQEAAAMQDIVEGIGFGQEIYALWDEYAKQATIEAKFVKALDKIESFLHLDVSGTDVYTPEQFHGDYADAAVKNFDAAAKHFPPLKAILDPIKKSLKEKFASLGITWIES